MACGFLVRAVDAMPSTRMVGRLVPDASIAARNGPTNAAWAASAGAGADWQRNREPAARRRARRAWRGRRTTGARSRVDKCDAGIVGWVGRVGEAPWLAWATAAMVGIRRTAKSLSPRGTPRGLALKCERTGLFGVPQSDPKSDFAVLLSLPAATAKLLHARKTKPSEPGSGT